MKHLCKRTGLYRTKMLTCICTFCETWLFGMILLSIETNAYSSTYLVSRATTCTKRNCGDEDGIFAFEHPFFPHLPTCTAQ